ncbi:hypothetical protein BKA83DRAFT_4501224 [Pisolithus microcarpus]|nr:hypothetical protein BKA83DRAFT_4501224 [Pisolithus microcarpus]
MSRNGRKGGAKGRNRRGSVGGLWVLYTSYLGSTLDEIHDVFGDGHEYDWALAGDTEVGLDEEAQKPEMKYQDVFEPSEIRARMLTEDDDLILLHPFSPLHQNLTESDIEDATAWVMSRLSARKTRDFFSDNGPYRVYRDAPVLAVSYALRLLSVQEFEAKTLSRASAYEIAKRSVISKLVEGFAIRPHDVIQNFTSSDRPNFVEDQELNPTTFTEQFVDPDPVTPRQEEEALEEDDLELLEENTGTPFRNRLTCLCRGRDGRSPPASSSSRRKQVVESSEDVLDDDEDLPQVQDIRRIWDDERAGRGQEDEEVPCIWTHKRDYISYFNPQEIRTRIDLTSLAELQRIHISGQKYHSLVERRNALFVAYSRLNVEDYHSERVNTKPIQLRW